MTAHQPGLRLIAKSTLLAALVLLLPSAALARQGGGPRDHAAIFSTLNIPEDQPSGDIACVFCTVNVGGDVHGDLAVVFGTVNIASGRTITGDVATVFSTAHFGEDLHIHGDLANVFSTVDNPSAIRVDGDRSLVGSGFGITILLAPILLLVGIIWLITYLVRENRARYIPYPPAPRRF